MIVMEARPVVDDKGWIIAVEVDCYNTTIRVPINEIHDFTERLRVQRDMNVVYCQRCSGRGMVDLNSDPEDLDKKRCDWCGGSGRLPKNVNKRVPCKHETWKSSDGRGTLVIPRCTNVTSSCNGKACKDTVTRDCQDKVDGAVGCR